jgi:hypothetical protein
MPELPVVLQNINVTLVISRHPGSRRTVDALQDSGFMAVETPKIKDRLCCLENPDLSLVIVMRDPKIRALAQHVAILVDSEISLAVTATRRAGHGCSDRWTCLPGKCHCAAGGPCQPGAV